MNDRLPAHIKSVTAYLVIYCDEIEYEYRTPTTFKTINSSHGWSPIPVDDIRLRNFESLHFGCYVELLRVEIVDPMDVTLDESLSVHSLSVHSLTLSLSFCLSAPKSLDSGCESDHKNVNELEVILTDKAENIENPEATLDVSFNVTSIRWNLTDKAPLENTLDDELPIEIPPIPSYDVFLDRTHEITRHFTREWLVDGELLHKFQTAKHSQGFYSPNFDGGSWCLSCSPCGVKKKVDGRFCLALKLLRLPCNVKSIKVHNLIHILSDDGAVHVRLEDTKVLDYKKRTSRFILSQRDSETILSKWCFEDAKWIKITVEVIVEEVLTMD